MGATASQCTAAADCCCDSNDRYQYGKGLHPHATASAVPDERDGVRSLHTRGYDGLDSPRAEWGGPERARWQSPTPGPSFGTSFGPPLPPPPPGYWAQERYPSSFMAGRQAWVERSPSAWSLGQRSMLALRPPAPCGQRSVSPGLSPAPSYGGWPSRQGTPAHPGAAPAVPAGPLANLLEDIRELEAEVFSAPQAEPAYPVARVVVAPAVTAARAAVPVAVPLVSPAQNPPVTGQPSPRVQDPHPAEPVSLLVHERENGRRAAEPVAGPPLTAAQPAGDKG